MKRKTTFLAKASMMLLAVLFSFTSARADEITVYADGEATSSNVPVEGYWADSYQKSEFVIAQAELTALAGNTITQMTFYLSSPAAAAWGGNFQVFMKEVDEATISAYSGTDDATLVFEGPLDATQSTMTLEFDQPYTYNGGNLLVGVYQTVKGTYKGASFAGAEVEGASIQGHSSNSLDEVTANQKNFIPKTTFTYTIGGFDGVLKPTGLKVNYDGGLEATVSWVSDESLFDIDVNDVVTENVENPYTLTGLSLGTTYTIKVRAKRGEEVSNWSSAVTFTTEYGAFSLPYYDSFEDGIGPWTLVDCHASTGVNTNGSGHESAYSFDFRYSSYPPQYLISPEFNTTAPIAVSFWYKIYSASYPETFQVGYSATKDVDAFTWEDEVTATNKDEWLQYETTCPVGTKYVAIKYNSNDMYHLFVDDFSFEASDGFAKPADLVASEITKNSVKLSWTEKGTATAWVINVYDETNDDSFGEFTTSENPYTLTGLDPETEYTANVRPAGENTKWSDPIHFTTDVAFPAPTDLAVVPAAKSAEISWTGNAEAKGYNLRYREAGAGAGGEFVSDFEDSSMGEWTTIDADGDGYDWVLGSACGGIYLVEGGSLAGGGNGGSEDFVVSGSYSNVAGALTPDNWLVSPLVTLGGSISFYAGGQDASYANEYFGVFVSTTSNTDPAAFTQLDAWTLNADGTGTRSSRRKDQGVWGLFTVDLSAYAGQTGYVAIRHFNCTDQFMLNIDDITIVQPGGGEEEPWTVVNDVTSPYTIEGLTPETKYQVQVQAVYSEGESQWAAKAFTTPEAIPAPTNFAVSDITKNSAKLSWTENGTATEWVINVYNETEDDSFGEFTTSENPYTLTGLAPETEYTAYVRPAGENEKWSAPVKFTTDIAFPVPTDLAASNVTATSAEISWTAAADATGAELQWAEGEAGIKDWYKYDNGTNASSVGLGGGTFSWGVMFPAGSYTGNTVSKVSVFDVAAMTGSVTIYNDGDAAPAEEVVTVPVTFTGVGAFIDIEVNATIDDTKNVWVIINNESGASYPAATAADDLGDANGRWVELSGTWYDVANVGISGQCFMVRAEIGSDVDPSTLAWTTVDEATSPFELTGLNPETSYAVRVKSIFEDGESQWTITGFKTLTNNPIPYDIAADLVADGATLTWNGEGESYNVQYRSAESTGATIFEDDFSGDLSQWTLVTAGEGDGWVISEYGATAYSWTQSAGALAADNWLISPAVELGGIVKFTTLTASSYPDSYEVLLSTTGTETTDFTETLQAMATAGNEVVTIDLTAYAGQTGYIAIHHVSEDCYILAIQNFGVYEYIPAGAWQEMAVTEKTATISGLATNNLYEYQIQSVKGGSTSEWSKLADFALLTLDSNVDNSGLINTYNGKFAHVTLANRTFIKDGKWNTIYLPFDMSLDEVAASSLGDADIRTLKNVSKEGNDVTLTFTEEDEALTTWGDDKFFGGVAYIAKWAEGSNTVNPEFANVTITSSQYYVGDQNSVKFVGTYAPKEFDADDTSILFVGADNKLNYPKAGATIGAMRGYFQLIGITAGEPSGVKFYTNLDDEDPTGISLTSTLSEGEGDWYDLGGRKLAGKPIMKGIYVNGGRKVTIK